MRRITERSECTAIVPNVYQLLVGVDGFDYRAYLVDCDEPILVDTGWPSTTDALFEGIERAGVEPERVLITHADPDHIGGMDAVAERFDVEIWVPEQSDLSAEDGGEYLPERTPDHRFSDGDRIGSLEAIHVPGHEPDHHAFVDEEQGYVITGDAVNGSDLRGLPPGGFVLPPAVFSDDLNQAEQSLERLLAYEFDTALVFHGASVLTGAKERLRSFVNFPGRPEGSQKGGSNP